MATFVTTIVFSDQGVKNIKDTCKRAEAFKKVAKKSGVEVRNVFWTLGPFDGLIVFDALDEETATTLMLKLSSAGNVRTRTARAYNSAEMTKIIAKV